MQTSSASPAPLTATEADVLSVVIVSWNTRDHLAACLTALQQSVQSREWSNGGRLSGMSVVVVDNASSDGSASLVRERFRWVQRVENRENVGFARACNQGIRAAAGRYILLLNPDAEVSPGALERLIGFLDDTPAAGVVGPRLLNEDGSLQVSCFPLPTLAGELARLLHLDTLPRFGTYRVADWPLDRPRQVEALKGACLLLRREALDRVGLLDERYFIYTEEIDLCRRLGQAGWAAYWLPSAVVLHHGGRSTRQVEAEMFLRLYQSKVLYFRKHFGRRGAQAYKLILALAALPRLLVGPLARLEPRPARDRHRRLANRYASLLRALPRF